MSLLSHFALLMGRSSRSGSKTNALLYRQSPETKRRGGLACQWAKQAIPRNIRHIRRHGLDKIFLSRRPSTLWRNGSAMGNHPGRRPGARVRVQVSGSPTLSIAWRRLQKSLWTRGDAAVSAMSPMGGWTRAAFVSHALLSGARSTTDAGGHPRPDLPESRGAPYACGLRRVTVRTRQPSVRGRRHSAGAPRRVHGLHRGGA
jgi:hypothetical protein